MQARSRLGFTLVELLVVIAIIGILVALLLPAVQSARESARLVQCGNSLKQMGLASMTHLQQHGHLPTGGWGWGWAGEPDRGFGRRQPSGWHYNILPYMEQVALHQLGRNGNRAEGKLRAETPVEAFICPSRRRAIAYPYPHGSPFYNIDKPSVIGRSDYAANSGDCVPGTSCLGGMSKGPGTLSDGDNISENDWLNQPGSARNLTGVIFRRSEVKQAQILDGTSNTYLVGERTIDPDNYLNGNECANDQGWDMGYDYDVNRWTAVAEAYRPKMDKPGQATNCAEAFGSAHRSGFGMVFCDGSVHVVDFGIDLEIHRRLGNRMDKLPVDLKYVH